MIQPTHAHRPEPRWRARALVTLLVAGWPALATAQPAPPRQPPVPAPTPTPPQSDADRARAEAQALVTEGVAALDKAPATALDRFQRAYAVFPSPKVLVNTGAALRKLGRLADACNVYQRYLDDPGADSTRRAELQTFLAETDPKVGLVTVTGSAGAELQFDGAAPPWLPPATDAWLPAGTSTRWRVAPGAFAVRARKPGFVTAAQAGNVVAGGTATVSLTLVAEPTPVEVPPPDGGGGGTNGGGGGGDTPDGPPDDGGDVIAPVRPSPPAVWLGAAIDAAIDGKGQGVAITPGLTVRLGARLELAAKALLGGSKGAYLGGTAYLLTGKVKPQLSVGVPIFFSDGARLGLRGAAGACVDVAARLSVVAEVGGEYFVNPEMDRYDFVLVPVVGLHARL